MKFHLTKTQLTILFLVGISISIGTSWYFKSNEPIDHYQFQDVTFSFRDDLKLAKNITVHPSEEAILNTIWNPNRENITITFTNTSDGHLTAVNSFEISYKLAVAYGQFSWLINFNGKSVDSFDGLNGTEQNLIIAMVPPSIANWTGVEMDDNVIYIKGKTPREFDLATIKFIMSALNITV